MEENVVRLPVPDPMESYLARGWTIDSDGRWIEPEGDDGDAPEAS